MHLRAAVLQKPGGKKPAPLTITPAEINAVEDRRQRRGTDASRKNAAPAANSKKIPKPRAPSFFLAHADPDDRPALQRPSRRGPAAVESERNRQRAKDHSESEERLDQQANLWR